MAASSIPRFFLYGEAPRQVDERFLHLEPIDDRTRPANWNIRPHTHADLNHVFHVVEGGGRMRADTESFAFQAPCLMLVPAGVVHAFAYVAETRGAVLTISQDCFDELARREDELRQLFARPAVLGHADSATMSDAFDRLSRELAWTAPGHRLSVEALLSTVLVEALRLSHHADQQRARAVGPYAALVARFRELVERHYRAERSVERYAEWLGTPPRRLRAACLAVTGAPPYRLIQDRLLLEAKRQLLYSNLTIAETAYHLGFDDPAYFTRLFSKACGVSPRQFRNTISETEVASQLPGVPTVSR
jgi:AraC family transcriptional activator of pobA